MLFLFCSKSLPWTATLHQFEKFNLMGDTYAIPAQEKIDKVEKNIEELCKSCTLPTLRCNHSEIGKVETRMRPNERQKRIIELLSFRRHETIGNFANEFGVSRDTIKRDIITLQEEYPIISERGYEGGISLPDGYYISKKHLTPKQVDAIHECIATANPELRSILVSILNDFAW